LPRAEVDGKDADPGLAAFGGFTSLFAANKGRSRESIRLQTSTGE